MPAGYSIYFYYAEAVQEPAEVFFPVPPGYSIGSVPFSYCSATVYRSSRPCQTRITTTVSSWIR